MGHDFSKVVDRRGTYCTQWDYTADRFGRDDVIPFSISDMDLALPSEMVNYLQSQLIDGIYGYTRWRNDLLLDSIVKWYDIRFDYKVSPCDIIYSPTVIYSLSQLIDIKSNKDDGVFVLTPAYDAFFKVIEDGERKLITSEMVKVQDKFELNREEFVTKLKEAKIFLLCSPFNPLGMIYTKEDLAFIIKVCKQHDVFIISDEIHMDITYGNQHIPITKVAKEYDYQDGVAIITSATKTFNFPGLLFSYVIITDEGLKDEFLRCLKNKHGLSSCTILGMKATAYAYNNLSEWVDELNDYLLSNFNLLKEELSDTKLELHEHSATYLVWIDASYYNIDKLIDIMYNETKVGIMSGDVYGCHGYLRINIGCSQSKLIEGIERIKQSLELYEEKDEE